jgi:putative colanic acid biosynthesis UDP-glucose lipid carrier transferase
MASRNLLPSAIARVVDVIVFIGCGILAFLHYQSQQEIDLDFQRYLSLILLSALVFVLLNNQLYRSWRSEGFFKLIQTVGTVVAKTWILIVFWLLFSKTNDFYSRAWILIWAIYTFFGLLLARYITHVFLGRLRAQGINLKHVVIIGSSSTAKELQERIERSPWSGFKVAKY